MRRRSAPDTIERNLLAYLEEDARVPVTKLAERLGIARSTVKERIARLERDGTIVGYVALVRRPDASPQTMAFLHLACERLYCRRIADGLERLPEVTSCYSVSAPYELMCAVEVPLTEDLDALIDEVAAIRGVRSVSATVVLSTRFRRGQDLAPAPTALAALS